ncbi:MAG TPA: hypothetical protein VH414_16095, partial [Lichenihabitans sp.]|nr:hypothetical protein [Lichenihabitans sp.]
MSVIVGLAAPSLPPAAPPSAPSGKESSEGFGDVLQKMSTATTASEDSGQTAGDEASAGTSDVLAGLLGKGAAGKSTGSPGRNGSDEPDGSGTAGKAPPKANAATDPA